MASCVVSASFDASDVAELSRYWSAELSPSSMYAPVATGALALVPDCSAPASEDAYWSVEASWPSSCAWPEPPHPAKQLSLLDWD